MRKYFKLSSFLLYIISFLGMFLIGLIYVKLSGAAEGQGLAGGAIVLFNGLVFGVLGILLAVFAIYIFPRERIQWLIRILGILVILAYGIAILSVRLNASDYSLTTSINKPYSQQSSSTTLGFFKPNINESDIISFIQSPYLDLSAELRQTVDSIRFVDNEYGNREIAYAPPWFAPAHMKLDYDILFFEVTSLGSHYAEVIVNKHTNKTTWVKLEDGVFIDWPSFLLRTHSVEITAIDQNIFRRPFSTSDKIDKKYTLLQPIMIKGNWLKVNLIDDQYKVIDSGWILWRDDDHILLRYNLLS